MIKEASERQLLFGSLVVGFAGAVALVSAGVVGAEPVHQIMQHGMNVLNSLHVEEGLVEATSIAALGMTALGQSINLAFHAGMKRNS